MSAAILLCALAILALTVGDRLHRQEQQQAAEWIETFRNAFPDACPACSYHRMGIHHGHARPGSIPPPHPSCPEAGRVRQ